MDATLSTWAVLDNNPKGLKCFNFSSYKLYKVGKNSDVKATNRELREERRGIAYRPDFRLVRLPQVPLGSEERCALHSALGVCH